MQTNTKDNMKYYNLCMEVIKPESGKITNIIITLSIISCDWSFYAALMELTQILYQRMQQYLFALHINTQAQKPDSIWSRYSCQRKTTGTYRLLPIYIRR